MIKFCALASGSSGNCYYVSSENTSILIDAGISLKGMTEKLESVGERIDSISDIVLTHEHSDHIKGLKALLKKYDVTLHLTESTYDALACDLTTSRLPVRIFEKRNPLRIGDLHISAKSVSHDAIDPVCYNIRNQVTGHAVGIITDLGWADPDVFLSFADCDLILIESNHDIDLLKMGSYPAFLKQRILGRQGHLSNNDAGYIVRELLKRGRLKQVVLGHLSENNNHPQLARITVEQLVREYGFVDGDHYDLDVTVQGKTGKMYYLRGTGNET